MSDQLQYSLFQDTWEQKFHEWVHTPKGREVANKFIRIAYGLKQRGKKVGAKMIIERIRWNITLKNENDDGEFKINNNFTSYLARFAMEREPSLSGYFQTRVIGRTKKRKAVVVEYD